MEWKLLHLWQMQRVQGKRHKYTKGGLGLLPLRIVCPKWSFLQSLLMKEQHDDVPSSHEPQDEPGEFEKVEDHSDTEGEEFHEGDLYSVENINELVLEGGPK